MAGKAVKVGGKTVKIKRKPGHLYFVSKGGELREAKMNKKGGKRGRKVCRRSR